MVALCSNRPEPFGPKSKLHPSLPTTCFLEVIVVPLPIWLLLLITPLLVALHSRNRKRRALKDDGASARSRIAKAIAVVYYILVFAMLAMETLEITRLSLAHLGIGLLPFVYVGVLTACALHTFVTMRLAKVAGVLFWVALAATMAIKLGALRKEEGVSERVGVTARYPLGDQVTDNGVMIGVEVVLAILEILYQPRTPYL